MKLTLRPQIGETMAKFGRYYTASALLLILISVAFFIVYPSGRLADEIVLAENASPLSALTIIAHEREFFKDEGLNIKVSRFTSGKLALDAVLGGGADVATAAETPLMFAAFGGQDFRIISTIFLSGNACKVVARADHHIHRPDDLRGKRIATFIGTNAEFFTKKFLDTYDIATSDVEIVNLTPTDMVVALDHGDIDAYMVWEPFIYIGKSLLGDRAVIFDVPGLYTTTFNVVAKPDFLKKNAKAAAALVRALQRSSTFVTEHQKESIDIVAKYTNIPATTLQQVWKDYQFPVSLDDKLIAYLTEQAKWAIDTERAKPPAPDYRKYLDPEFLISAGK